MTPENVIQINSNRDFYRLTKILHKTERASKIALFASKLQNC